MINLQKPYMDRGLPRPMAPWPSPFTTNSPERRSYHYHGPMIVWMVPTEPTTYIQAFSGPDPQEIKTVLQMCVGKSRLSVEGSLLCTAPQVFTRIISSVITLCPRQSIRIPHQGLLDNWEKSDLTLGMEIDIIPGLVFPSGSRI